jgi:hypothetical protein
MDDTWTGSFLCRTAKRAVRDFSIVVDEDAVVANRDPRVFDLFFTLIRTQLELLKPTFCRWKDGMRAGVAIGLSDGALDDGLPSNRLTATQRKSQVPVRITS